MLFQVAPARRDAQHGHRRRPYRVEHTGSLSTSEVKRRRARLVLGWRTAWELVRVLSAFAFVCPVSFARALCASTACERAVHFERATVRNAVSTPAENESKDPVGQSSLVGHSSPVQSVSWSGPVQSVGRVWSVSPVSVVQSISWSSPVWSSLVGQSCTVGQLVWSSPVGRSSLVGQSSQCSPVDQLVQSSLVQSGRPVHPWTLGPLDPWTVRGSPRRLWCLEV
jgi:hypothetical protein